MPSKVETIRLLVEALKGNETEHGFGTAPTVANNPTFTGGPIFSGTRIDATPVLTTQNLSLTTSQHSGKIVIANAANLVITLPTLSTNDAGEEFRVVTGVASTGTGTAVNPTTDAALNGTTNLGTGLTNTGATDAVGDMVGFRSSGTTWWQVGRFGTWA